MPKNVTQPNRIGLRALAFTGIMLVTAVPLFAAVVGALVLAVSATEWLRLRFGLGSTAYVIICAAFCLAAFRLSASLLGWLLTRASEGSRPGWQRWCAGIGFYAFVACMVTLCCYIGSGGRG